jgi:hypothetical protein
MDVVAGRPHLQHPCRAGQHERDATDAEPTPGDDQRWQRFLGSRRQHEVDGEPDRGQQAPDDADRVERGVAEHVEHEHQAGHGDGTAGEGEPSRLLPVPQPQPCDDEQRARVLEQQRDGDGQGLHRVEVGELAAGHGDQAVRGDRAAAAPELAEPTAQQEQRRDRQHQGGEQYARHDRGARRPPGLEQAGREGARRAEGRRRRQRQAQARASPLLHVHLHVRAQPSYASDTSVDRERSQRGLRP